MAKGARKHIKIRQFVWIAVIGLLMVILTATSVDLKSLHAQAHKLNGVLVFALMAVLPLIGLPASVLYAVAGAKFGQAWGLLAVAAAIAFHLIASWWIGHSWLRNPVDRLLDRLHYHKPQVPKGEYVPFCLLIALIPGAPYTLKNYLLVLGGVPWRPYFWTCWPAHIVSAALGVFFGHFTGSMSAPKVIFLVCYALLLFGLSRYVIRRLSARKGFQTSEEEEAASAEADTSSTEVDAEKLQVRSTTKGK